MTQIQSERSAQPSSVILQMGSQAGVVLHLTSLPGPHGSGDIGDAAMSFIDRLVRMGIGVWQFLPTGPTAYGNSPYQPLSAFAGNPLLVGLGPLIRLGLLRESDLSPLNDLPRSWLDHQRALPLRSAVLARAAARFEAGRFPGLKADYEDFLHAHDDGWLDDFALFRTLKTEQGERAWPQWEEACRRREPAAMRAARSRHRLEMGRIKFVQFLFEHQWRHLRQYARENGICLFGDMPIYIALDSADAWACPQMLLLDGDGRPSHVAGVPPDYFSASGQLWGNPLYAWAFHRNSGYRWWIDRVRHAVGQTEIVRIDHFRGFESFWSVPAGADTAADGTWVPGPGDAIFEALEAALGRLPIVAEDLGVITAEVTALRNRHEFPGMRVLQFEAGDPQFRVDSIEENCVCYTGTHDNDTTIGWFRGCRSDTRTETEARQTRNNVLRLTGGSPETVHLDLIRLAFSSRAALAVAPMQDYLGLGSEARMNTPGTTHGNWRWRLPDEALQPAFLDRVAEMTSAAGRAGPVRFEWRPGA